jgi:DNA-binding GntR family transcriptional regulator
MTRERFADLMNTRQICEGAATECAARNVTARELKAIRKECAALTKAARNEDIDAYLLHNYQFKFLIYSASRSASQIFLIETLWLQVGPFLRQFAASFNGRLSDILGIDYHDEALEALERTDAEAAARAIRTDIAEGARFLLKHGAFA